MFKNFSKWAIASAAIIALITGAVLVRSHRQSIAADTKARTGNMITAGAASIEEALNAAPVLEPEVLANEGEQSKLPKEVAFTPAEATIVAERAKLDALLTQLRDLEIARETAIKEGAEFQKVHNDNTKVATDCKAKITQIDNDLSELVAAIVDLPKLSAAHTPEAEATDEKAKNSAANLSPPAGEAAAKPSEEIVQLTQQVGILRTKLDEFKKSHLDAAAAAKVGLDSFQAREFDRIVLEEQLKAMRAMVGLQAEKLQILERALVK